MRKMFDPVYIFGPHAPDGKSGFIVRKRFVQVRPFPAFRAVRGAGNRGEFREKHPRPACMGEPDGVFHLPAVSVRMSGQDIGRYRLRARLSEITHRRGEFVGMHFPSGGLLPRRRAAFQPEEKSGESGPNHEACQFGVMKRAFRAFGV